jgi:hypothetical protein
LNIFCYTYIVTFTRKNIVSIHPPWITLFLYYSAPVPSVRVTDVFQCFAMVSSFNLQIITNMAETLYVTPPFTVHAQQWRHVFKVLHFTEDIMEFVQVSIACGNGNQLFKVHFQCTCTYLWYMEHTKFVSYFCIQVTSSPWKNVAHWTFNDTAQCSCSCKFGSIQNFTTVGL